MIIVPKKPKLLTRRKLLRSLLIAAPAVITLPRVADAQFGACLPGFCKPPPSSSCGSNSVVFQSNFDGTNGSTTIPDLSTFLHGNAVCYHGAALDTAVKQWGTASSKFLGGSFPNAPSIEWAASSQWNLGNMWTIEGYTQFNSNAQDQAPISQWHGALSIGWLFRTMPANALQFLVSDGVVFTVQIDIPAAYAIGSFNYYCFESNGTKVRFYINGVMVGSQIPSATALGNGLVPLVFGSDGDGGTGGRALTGWNDEWRITAGCARYNTDTSYPVPTAAFPIP